MNKKYQEKALEALQDDNIKSRICHQIYLMDMWLN